MAENNFKLKVFSMEVLNKWCCHKAVLHGSYRLLLEQPVRDANIFHLTQRNCSARRSTLVHRITQTRCPDVCNSLPEKF